MIESITNCDQEFEEYKIVEVFQSKYIIMIYGILMLNINLKKYNFYILDHYDLKYSVDNTNIAIYHKPLDLEYAQKIFPQYNLVQENYGFVS